MLTLDQLRQRRAAHRAARTELSDAYADALLNHGAKETDRWLTANERVGETGRALPLPFRLDIDL